MPKTTWELELKSRGRAQAKALARDLRELDGVLRSLGESSAVLGTLARDAAALRGARVRIRAERSVGDAHSRQMARARTEMTESERVRRSVEAGRTKMAQQEGQARLRAYRREQRDEQRAAQQVARQNSRAAARDRADATRLAARQVRTQARDEQRAAQRQRAQEREGRSLALTSLGATLGIVTGIVGATTGALSVITDMIGAVGSLVARISGAVLEMIAFREASLTTLRAMARDDSGRRLTGRAADRQAREQFRFAQSFARQTPLDTAQVIDLQRQTSAAGFTGARNRDVVRAAADVGAFNPNDPAAASHFLLGLGQLRNASSVRTQDLRQTAQAAGLGENDILREIARQAGQTQRRGETDAAYNGRIQAMQRANRFTGAQGVEGVLAALQARNGGALGSFAIAQGGTLTGTISNLRGAVLDFVTSIDDIENLPGIRALKETLNGVVDALTGSGPTAERLRSTFASIVNQASQFVADLGGGRDGAASLLARMLDSAERLWPFVRDVSLAFGGAAWEGLKSGLAPLLEQLGELGNDSSGTVAFAAELGRDLGVMLAYGVRITVAFAGLVSIVAVLGARLSEILATVVEWPQSILAAITSVGGLFEGFGASIVDGFRNGFFGLSDSAVTDVANWSNDIANASRANLGIHSPSKVFADIGSQIPAGMSLGIDSGARDVERSLSGMVAPPSLGGFGALSGLGAMGGISAVFNITVNGASNDTGRELGEAAWSAFVDRFEQANAMAGG
jgi:flagellar biosynthesis GTPase FlhF